MRHYSPDGDTLRAFMLDKASRVKVIQGPVGSGTSSACCLHIYQQALEQHRQADGKQRFRVYVLRETYAKLEETTIKTWLDWFPEKEFGRFYWSKPFRHEIRVGPLELDVIFVAMEDIADAAAFFKSLEPSLIWINEGQFTAFSIINEAVDRVSPPRYPAVKDGGCVWGGLILDTNAPPADHWIPIMRGDVPAPDWMTEDQKNSMKRPDNWRFYMQPAGLLEVFENKVLKGYEPNPDAENLKYLPANFYMEKIGGKTKSWIDANIMNRSSVVVDGKPVYPDFRREAHVADRNLEPIPGLPIIVGIDFGRQPAASCWQNLRGRWILLREIIGRDMGANKFAPIVKGDVATHFPDYEVHFWGDPTGGLAGQANDDTPFKVFRQHGMVVRAAPGQNLNSLRKEAVETILCRTVEGKPAMLVDPRCITFITGMAGGYHYKRVQVSGERYADEPNKNQYSHVCESAEYAVLGGGEGRGIVTIDRLWLVFFGEAEGAPWWSRFLRARLSARRGLRLVRRSAALGLFQPDPPRHRDPAVPRGRIRRPLRRN
jgi:hypothetical protein